MFTNGSISRATLIGLLLAISFVVLDTALRWWSRRHILAEVQRWHSVGDIGKFQEDMIFHFDGRITFPIITEVESSMLRDEFPGYWFVKVIVPAGYFGFRFAGRIHTEIWAVNRGGGHNWFFCHPDSVVGTLMAFLATTRRRIRTVEEAEGVRRIANELSGLWLWQFEMSNGAHRREEARVWHVVGRKRSDGVRSILEIYLDENDVVETGRLIYVKEAESGQNSFRESSAERHH